MNFVGYVACYLSILLNSYVLFWCYSKTGVERKTSKLKYFFSVLIISILVFIVNMCVTTSVKFVLIYLLMCLLYYYNYEEKYLYFTLFKTILIYILMFITDIIASLILMNLTVPTNPDVINLLKALGTLLNSILIFGLFKINYFVNLLNKFLSMIMKKEAKILTIFAILLLITLWCMGFEYRLHASFVSFVSLITIVIFLCLMVSVMVYQYFNNKEVENEKQQLQVLMHEYENVLNQTSENRHEMLNDLLILRSIADKNSSEFTRTLDGIIRQYDTKKFKKYTSLAKLPTGVKGMIYYKIAFINENEINFDTVVNGVDYAKFEAMDKDLYYKVCKILGILMDNAIDACVDSNKKKLVVSVYTENEDLCVEIDNSYSGIVDKDGIKKKGYTTKGKNHGYGLTILNRIVDETEELNFEQSINEEDKLFTSILKIKL
jgi:two-component system sensor histidine kinase AgrC